MLKMYQRSEIPLVTGSANFLNKNRKTTENYERELGNASEDIQIFDMI